LRRSSGLYRGTTFGRGLYCRATANSWSQLRLWAREDELTIQSSEPVYVQIIGAPVACTTGTTDTWRSVAGYAAQQLAVRFGEYVRVAYHDLFDADCPPLPLDAHLPLVLVNGAVVSNGAKISVPQIRRAIERQHKGSA
jgi:hypothetical protein